MNCWNAIEDRLPDVFSGVYLVRLDNGIEMDAFFYQDAMVWIAFYGQKTSHWWDAKGDHKRLDNVTHWKERERTRGICLPGTIE